MKYFFTAVFLTIPFFSVKIWRWKLLLNRIDINYTFPEAIRTYGAGLFAGQVTPGQLGELIRGVFLARRGYDLSLSTGSVILERFLDLLLLLILVIPGVVVFLGFKIIHIFLSIIFVGVLLVLIIRFGGWLKRVNHLNSIKFLDSLLSRIKNASNTMILAIKNRRTAELVVLSTVLALVLYLFRLYFLLLALDLSLPLINFIFGVAFASVAGLLPISVAGIGIRDAALILVFLHAGQPAEGAVAFSMLILLVAYGLNIIWGFPAWLLETKKDNHER